MGERVPRPSRLVLVGGSPRLTLEVYVADPYSIALSKLDRGFDTDLDDLVFLVQRNLVILEELERITRNALSRAKKFDLDPEILAHLQELKNRLK